MMFLLERQKTMGKKGKIVISTRNTGYVGNHYKTGHLKIIDWKVADYYGEDRQVDNQIGKFNIETEAIRRHPI